MADPGARCLTSFRTACSFAPVPWRILGSTMKGFSYLGPIGLRGYEGRMENQVEKKHEHEFRTSMMQEGMHVLDI